MPGRSGGYKAINYNAMKLLPRGGYLATCSCSHFMPSELFEKMLLSAARDAGVSLKLIEARQTGAGSSDADERSGNRLSEILFIPNCLRNNLTLMNVPETDYLKFYLFQIV